MWLSYRWDSEQWGPKVGDHLHGVAALDDGVAFDRLIGHLGVLDEPQNVEAGAVNRP